MSDPNEPSIPEAPQTASAAHLDEVQDEASFAAEQTQRMSAEQIKAATDATPGVTPITGRTASGGGGWQPPTVEEAAQLFPSYEVLGLLGRGGMGAVYKARQIELDRLVAIKLLPLEISADPDFADRFRREARAMAKLNHPNIISVYDFGTTSAGHLFFVMEFVEGANLHAIIHAQELNADQALWLAGQVCTALAYAHGKGVVHRDIKPANVMVDTEGNAKVADFGLARLTDSSGENLGHTMTGTVMGTPDYMAPEQMRGMNVDHRADIYSVGVMIYEMLCREVPRGIFSPPSVRTGCDRRIDSIVVKAMQSEPERRYQSTQEMQADVEAARTPLPAVSQPRAVSQPQIATRPRVAPRASAPQAPASSKSKGSRWFALATGLLVLAALGIVLMPRTKPKIATTKPAPASPMKSAPALPDDAVSLQKLKPVITTAPARQTLDLLALADPAKDTLKAEGYAGANQWSNTAGTLAFTTDGKSGKISAPVSLNALRDYEIEAEVAASQDSLFTLDFPISATNQATLDFGNDVTLAANENRQRVKIGDWPKDVLRSKVKIAGRVQVEADGVNGSLTALVNGAPVGTWHGPLSKLGKKVEMHPDFPGQLLPALFIFRGDRSFTAWTLRVFAGEAKVLRAGAKSTRSSR